MRPIRPFANLIKSLDIDIGLELSFVRVVRKFIHMMERKVQQKRRTVRRLNPRNKAGAWVWEARQDAKRIARDAKRLCEQVWPQAMPKALVEQIAASEVVLREAIEALGVRSPRILLSAYDSLVAKMRRRSLAE